MHKLSHSGVKPHSCDVCGLALMTRSHLKRHKRIHSGEKRHECAVCGKRFSERYMLERHMSVLHGRALERPPPTPRNTMSKLLKAQAQARLHAADNTASQSPSLIAGSWGPYTELTYSQP
ncbi:putative zinc finger protein Kr18 [Operophtera brumata]|uniref:Putative zinc finger protein Kr18 n=1 Tax=Operophtera brumata TaxID=104452 RepID=A0A0L7KUQ8_OPEBR|nr:putative zinc finger protein Kr18 [Operophtera brumata]